MGRLLLVRLSTLGLPMRGRARLVLSDARSVPGEDCAVLRVAIWPIRHNENGNGLSVRSQCIRSVERRLLGVLAARERTLLSIRVSDQPLPFELEYDKTIHVNALLLDGQNSEAKNSSKSIFRASAAPPIPDNHRRSRSSCSALVHAQSSC